MPDTVTIGESEKDNNIFVANEEDRSIFEIQPNFLQKTFIST